MTHGQEGVYNDRKAIRHRDGNQLQNGVELARSRASAGGRKENIANRVLGDSKHGTANGTSEARTKAEKHESKGAEIDPLALPYVMMSDVLSYKPSKGGRPTKIKARTE